MFLSRDQGVTPTSICAILFYANYLYTNYHLHKFTFATNYLLHKQAVDKTKFYTNYLFHRLAVPQTGFYTNYPLPKFTFSTN